MAVPHNLTGYVKKLYQMVSVCTDKPLSEIERIANEALDEGVINQRQYTVIRYRLPFLGDRRETSERVGELLGIYGKKVTGTMVGQLAHQAYLRLRGSEYWEVAVRELPREQLLKIEIDKLPWDANSSAIHALNSLQIFFEMCSYPILVPTAENLVEFLPRLSSELRPKAIEEIRKTLRKVGLLEAT